MLAMPRTVKALHGQPDMGFLHAKLWGVRIILVQYWRSMAQLLACVHDRDSAQLPALRAFNKAVGTDGARGIWHETCAIKPVQCENVYGNMTPFGVGRAGQFQPASGARKPAWQRVRAASKVQESGFNGKE